MLRAKKKTNTMQVKKKTKKKININGVKYKVDHGVFLLIEQLESRVANHTLALYNYIEIFHEAQDAKTDKETILHKYCMQLPYAEAVEQEITNPQEVVAPQEDAPVDV